MRKREEIEKDIVGKGWSLEVDNQNLIIELLLDIRELLEED